MSTVESKFADLHEATSALQSARIRLTQAQFEVRDAERAVEEALEQCGLGMYVQAKKDAEYRAAVAQGADCK
jgi:hypothetical protein